MMDNRREKEEERDRGAETEMQKEQRLLTLCFREVWEPKTATASHLSLGFDNTTVYDVYDHHS